MTLQITWALLVFAAAPPVCPPERCERDCEAGSSAACVQAAHDQQKANPLRAAVFLQRACKQGDGAACADLVQVFRLGQGLPADPASAAQYEQLACSLKHGPSCYALGQQAEQQAVTAGDSPQAAVSMGRAATFLFSACAVDVAAACVDLSRIYAWGSGVKTDVVAAAQAATRGCTLGDRAGCRYAAFFYEEGQGVMRDAAKAADLLRQGRDGRALKAPPMVSTDFAIVRLQTAPAGAELILDGLGIGVTPLTLRLAPGLHLVTARLSKRPDLKDRLVLRTGQRESRTLEWPSSLKLESVPPGANVRVDQGPPGKTPLSMTVDAGVHAIELELPGYLPERRQWTGEPGQLTTERWTLQVAPGSAAIDSVPTGASLVIDGQLAVTAPWAGDLSPGVHTVQASATGRRPVTKKFTVLKGAALQLKLELPVDPASVPATLKVSSVPDGAEVRVDQEVVGHTPFEGTISPGPHTVEWRLEGFEAGKQQKVRAANGQTVTAHAQLKAIKVAPAMTELTLTSVPAGARVKVDGKPRGVTPANLRVPPGPHSLELALAGFEAWTDSFQGAGGDVITREAKLMGSPVSAAVDSKPGGAALFIDAVEVGKTPWKGKARAGSHQLRLELPGFAAVKKDWVVAPVGPNRLMEELQKQPPMLTLSSPTEGAQVSVDGQARGKAPLTTEVTEGEHEVTVSAPGFEPFTTKVQFGPGQLVERTIGLTPSQAMVSFSSTPPAEFLVDGASVGRAPLRRLLVPGKHEVRARQEGFEDEVVTVQLAPGEARTIDFALRPGLPPPPPPPPAQAAGPNPDLWLASVKDPATSLETKRDALKHLAKGDAALTDVLRAVMPLEHRVELCREFGASAARAPVTVRATDAMKSELNAQVVVDGVPWSTTPITGNLSACIQRIEVRHDGQVRAQDVVLAVDHPTGVVADFGGRPAFVSLGLAGDLGYTPDFYQSDYHALEPVQLSGAVRFDYWGRFFHFNAAAKVSTTWTRLLNLPVTPGLDLFFGLGAASSGEHLAVHFAVDVGVWNTTVPTARLTFAFNIVRRVFLILGGDVHLHPTSFMGPQAPLLSYVFFGGTAGLSIAW